MAIRLRNSGGMVIALCAAETDAEAGDVYIDDNQHYALAAKFSADWRGRTIDTNYSEQWAEMEKHKLRDAEEELNKWLRENRKTLNKKPLGSGPANGPYYRWS